MSRPVVVIGPPGAGKTTVGRRAAEELAVPFVDLDEHIGDVDTIFRTQGEAAFRAREHAALLSLLDAHAPLIAAGAGVVDGTAARLLLGERAACIELDVDEVTALARLASSPRPWLPKDALQAASAYRAREEGRRTHRRTLAILTLDGRADEATAAHALARAFIAVQMRAT